MSKLVKVEELFAGDLSIARKENELLVLLNHEPKITWVREHPSLNGYKYIPVEILEYLLTSIFTRWWVEVKDVKLIANSVVVTVRLHAISPVDGSEIWQDGIGAAPIQTAKGAGATDFNEMKSAAIQMGAPAAESYAIKDAAEKFGKIFGKDLNRKNGMNYSEMLSNRLNYMDEADATNNQRQYIEKLLHSCSLDHDQVARIEREYLTYKAFEAEICIDMLKANQQDPIRDMASPTQTDIKNHRSKNIL